MASSSRITIAGIGLCSSIGGYHDACAANRAGINRFSAHVDFKTMSPGDEEPEPLTVSPAATNLYAYQDMGRIIKMISLAWEDLLANTGNDIPSDVTVLLALPDPDEREIEVPVAWDAPRNERLQTHLSSFIETLFNKTNPDLNNAPLQAVFGDRVSFARILQKAKDLISGAQASHCLLIVADSLLGEEHLQIQLENNQLKTGANPVGYIPGEGAVIILVSGPETQGKSKISLNIDVAIHVESAQDLESNHWLGNTLSELIGGLALEKYEQGWFPQVVSDVNGNENRAKELGMLEVKLKQCYPKAFFLDEHIPALGFGELGAMMGPIALATIVASLQRAYALHREFLITLSEDSGRRAVIRVGI